MSHRLRSRRTLFTYATLLSAVALLTVVPRSDVAAQQLDRTLATVRLHNTANISRNEYRRRLSLVEQQTARKLNDAQQKQLLDAMIDAELIMQDAKQLNIRARDQEVDDSIEQQRGLLAQQSGQPVSEQQFRNLIQEQTGIGWEEYRTQVQDRLIQEKYVLRVKRDLFASIKEPTDNEVRTFYEQNATQFTNPAIAHIEFLLLRTDNVSQAESDRLKTRARQLQRAATRSVSAFEEQKSASLNDTDVRATETILLRDNRQQADIYGPAFVRQVFELKDGAFAPAVLESKVGFHVLRVIERRKPKVLLLNDPILPGQSITVKSQIRNRLLLQQQQETLQQAVQETISDLRARAEIKTFLDRI